MADLSFTAPTAADIDDLVANMRPLDRQEVTASHGPDVKGTVQQAVSLSANVFAVSCDHGLLAIFGTIPDSLLSDSASIWMLGTDRLAHTPRSLSRVTARYVDEMLRVYPLLWNWVDARNEPAIKLLRWLGFQIGEPQPYGVQGLPFRRFEKRA